MRQEKSIDICGHPIHLNGSACEIIYTRAAVYLLQIMIVSNNA